MLNGTLPRAKLLVALKDSLPIDVVLMEIPLTSTSTTLTRA